jgi:hypothetical protein
LVDGAGAFVVDTIGKHHQTAVETLGGPKVAQETPGFYRGIVEGSVPPRNSAQNASSQQLFVAGEVLQ